jgi:hypothetical protein
MIKTTILVVTQQEEILSLGWWLLLIMLGIPRLSRYMTTESPATHHKKHRKHDYPVLPWYTKIRHFSYPTIIIAIPPIIKLYHSLNWTWWTWWYHLLPSRSMESRHNDHISSCIPNTRNDSDTEKFHSRFFQRSR